MKIEPEWFDYDSDNSGLDAVMNYAAVWKNIRRIAYSGPDTWCC